MPSSGTDAYRPDFSAARHTLALGSALALSLPLGVVDEIIRSAG